jgi:hypothetical protein
MSAQHTTHETPHSEENHVYKGGPAMILGYLLLFILVASAAWYWMGLHPEHTTEHSATHVQEATK